MCETDAGFCSMDDFSAYAEGQRDSLLEKILKYWPGDSLPKNVPDIGCGLGQIMESCKKRGSNLMV